MRRQKREEGRGLKVEEMSGEIMTMAQYTWHLSWRVKPPNAKSCLPLPPQKLHGKAPPPVMICTRCGKAHLSCSSESQEMRIIIYYYNYTSHLVSSSLIPCLIH